jgi:ATP-dependent DNA ligase
VSSNGSQAAGCPDEGRLEDSHQARLITRNGIDLAGYFPEIIADLVALPDSVIDGELVVLDDKG